MAGTGALATAGAFFGRASESSDAAPSHATDQRIFRFALLLEYLQAAFYTEASQRGALQGELREFAD